MPETEHKCHNPSCGQPLPAQYVCHRQAWFAVPAGLRRDVWRNYRPGQEDDKQPSAEYLKAIRAVIEFLQSNGIRCR